MAIPGLICLKTDRDRRIYSNRIINQIHKLLEEGYHSDVNKVSSHPTTMESADYTLKYAINRALELKKPSLRATSYPSYKSTVNLFQKWASENRILDMNITYFDKLHAIYFDDYIVAECGYAAKSVNGHV
jgi:hypothetical protein